MTFLVKFFPFILAWAFVTGSIRKDKILFLQKSSAEKNEILLVMTWTENEDDMTAGCEIFSDEYSINRTLATNDFQLRMLPEAEMQILLGDCLEFNHQRKKRDTDNIGSTDVSMDSIENDQDELSRTNKRTSNRRRGSRNRSLNKRMRQQGSKQFDVTTKGPSTTVALNEIVDDYDKWNRQNGTRNKTSSNSELERESEDADEYGKWNRQRGYRNETLANDESEHVSEESLDMNVTTTEPPTTPGYDGLPIIFPGTKWCGAGDIAENYDDLGNYEDTDRCCRAHDLCNDTLAPSETRNGLTNTSPFTKLSCHCDEEFYNCLENVRSIPANTIGNMYFNILRRECYMIDYPPSKTCKKYLTLFKLTCLEYEKDPSKEKVYQWTKPKRYSRI